MKAHQQAGESAMNLLDRAIKLVCAMNEFDAHKLNLPALSVQDWPRWAQRDFKLVCDELVSTRAAALKENTLELERMKKQRDGLSPAIMPDSVPISYMELCEQLAEKENQQRQLVEAAKLLLSQLNDYPVGASELHEAIRRIRPTRSGKGGKK